MRWLVLEDILKSDKSVSLRIDCDCNTEILDITYWKDDEPRVYYFTIYKSSAGMGFWYRLKHAYRYFIYGEFNGNSIVLQKPDFDKFIKVLLEHQN